MVGPTGPKTNGITLNLGKYSDTTQIVLGMCPHFGGRSISIGQGFTCPTAGSGPNHRLKGNTKD